MNKIIKNVLVKIEKAGFEAYLVGGYVRDCILKRETFDVDICTNALPKDLLSIFGDAVDNMYGGCFFKIGKYNFDVTTYRKDLKYINRKPSVVEYVKSLEEDIVRRDFTVNTICMNKNGKIVDFLHAKKDLKNQLIKMVGNEDEKLIEDPLRILRAVRFASTLNFEIDENLKLSIKKNKVLVKSLSKERIKSEFSKILLSKNYVYGFNLLKELGLLEVLDIEYEKIYFSSDLLVMFSQINLSDEYFTKIENKQIKNIKKIINYGIIDNTSIFNYGLYLSTVVGEVLGVSKKEVNKIYKSMWISESKPLCITSEDIMKEMNLSEGKIVGQIKKELECLILDKKLPNDKKKIFEYLKNRK